MRSLAAAILLLASASIASAGTVYEVTTTGATDTGSKNNGGDSIGQSFNSGTNTLLTSASLQINRDGLATATFTINLHLATGTFGQFLATGSALASATYSNSILSTDLQSFYDFTNLNWPLSPNTAYVLGIDSEPTASVKWTLNKSLVRDSTTGFMAGWVGYNAVVNSTADIDRHGATITAVPEPSTHVVVGAATAGLWLLMRRRGR